MIEQAPNSKNRISLSNTRSDIYGLPLAVIDWRVHAADLRKFEQVSSFFLKNWKVSPLSRIAEISARPKSAIAWRSLNAVAFITQVVRADRRSSKGWRR